MLVNSCVNQHPAVAADGKSVKTSEPLDHLADPGPTSSEDTAVLAECSAEVKERLRMMARRGDVAARRMTNAERNRQQPRGGNCAVVTAGDRSPCERGWISRWALPRCSGRPRSALSRSFHRRARLFPSVSSVFHRGQAQMPPC